MKRVHSIDWLQISTRGILNLLPNYTYKLLPFKTRVFNSIYEIFHKERLICTIACNPASPIIKKDTHLVKFDNKLLYSFDLFDYVDIIINKSGLKFQNITRLDICADFNYFDCNMTGTKFIENFHKNKYYHHSKSNFQSRGKQKKINVYNYLRFGSNESPINSYLYDKTLEMKEKTFKQHIFDRWRLNDLDLTKKVYRLEFSIKSSNICLKNNYYGQTEKLTLSNIKSDEWLQKLFYTLVDKYFKFSYANAFQAKKDLKPLLLFNHLNYNYTHSILTLTKDTTKSDKIFLKKLESFNNELRSTKIDLAHDCEILKHYFIDKHNLKEFYYKKVYSQ